MGKLQRADFPTVWLDPHSAREAIAHSGLHASTRHVVRAIAELADNRTGKAWPSLRTLAARTGLSERAIRDHTKAAVEAGYLWKVQRFNSSVIYRLAAPTGVVRLARNKTGRRARAIGALQKVDELLELDDGDLDDLNEPGDTDDSPESEALGSAAHRTEAEASAGDGGVDLTALTDEELRTYTGKALTGSTEYEAAKAERIRRVLRSLGAGESTAA